MPTYEVITMVPQKKIIRKTQRCDFDQIRKETMNKMNSPGPLADAITDSDDKEYNGIVLSVKEIKK